MFVVWENTKTDRQTDRQTDRHYKPFSFDAKVYKYEFEHKVLIG